MKIEQHEEAFKEHLKHINRGIEEGVTENQRSIGFHISQGSVELFALFLHKLHLIGGSGDQFDHRIFKNKNLIDKKLPLSFPSRNKILNLMKNIELERIFLCYGSKKPRFRIEKTIKDFQELRKIINKELKNGTK